MTDVSQEAVPTAPAAGPRARPASTDGAVRMEAVTKRFGEVVAVDDVTLDVGSGEFRQTLLDIYVPRYGEEWEKFLDSGPVFARIDAERMFAFSMPA